jgi:hypothetical protein
MPDETVDAVLREMRGDAHDPNTGCTVQVDGGDVADYADRFEAAMKRERAALRRVAEEMNVLTVSPTIGPRDQWRLTVLAAAIRKAIGDKP